MTEFETQNTVDVVIDDRSLTEARADVEDALSSVPMDVQASVSGGGGGSEVAARDRARQRQLMTAQTDSIDELREEFAENDVAEEWQEQHALSRERNRLLQQIAEGIDEGNFDRASRSGGAIGSIIGGGALLGIGALSGVLSSFSWPSLPEFGWPDLPDMGPPPKPGWAPIDVVEPDPVPVGEPDPVPVEDPGEVAVEEPETIPVEDPETMPIEKPDPVPEPGWAPIEVSAPTLSTEGVGSGLGEGAGVGALLAAGVGGALGLEGLRQFSIRSAGGASAGAPFPTPEAVGATDQDQFNQRRRQFNQQTPEWLQLPEIQGDDKFPGSVFTAEGRQAQVEGVRELVNAIKDFREDVRSTQEDTSSTRRTEVNVESNVSVDGATRREVERAAEEAKQKAIREFERQIRGR